MIVSGPPATGKTSLASRLADDFSLPLIAKDGIKEALFETFGAGGRDQSQVLGRGAFALLWHFLEAELTAGRSALLEGNFRAETGSRELERLASRFEFATLQIHCRAPVDVLYDRYEERAGLRHSGHADKERLADIRGLLDADRYLLQLSGELITVDTTFFDRVHYDAIRARVASHLGE